MSLVLEICPSGFRGLRGHGTSIWLEERLLYHEIKIIKMKIDPLVPITMSKP
jgi:hypothetical protein